MEMERRCQKKNENVTEEDQITYSGHWKEEWVEQTGYSS